MQEFNFNGKNVSSEAAAAAEELWEAFDSAVISFLVQKSRATMHKRRRQTGVKASEERI
jgi:hypothetical protein